MRGYVNLLNDETSTLFRFNLIIKDLRDFRSELYKWENMLNENGI